MIFMNINLLSIKRQKAFQSCLKRTLQPPIPILHLDNHHNVGHILNVLHPMEKYPMPNFSLTQSLCSTTSTYLKSVSQYIPLYNLKSQDSEHKLYSAPVVKILGILRPTVTIRQNVQPCTHLTFARRVMVCWQNVVYGLKKSNLQIIKVALLTKICNTKNLFILLLYNKKCPNWWSYIT